MEITLAPEITQNVLNEEKIHPAQLLSILDHLKDKIEILSLDCFDTVLWRKSATPKDMFFDLQEQPTFKKLGFTALMRIQAENTARMLKVMQETKSEVNLHEIYSASFPALSQDELNALAAEELATEIATAFAFPPMIQLIRAAKKLGMKVIIVSDTYLLQNELKSLLASKLPDDVFAAIDEVFCSCEFGSGKGNGLFKQVIKKMTLRPDSILHIGDNPHSDLASAKNQQIRAYQMIHPDNIFRDFIRSQTNAVKMLDSSIRYQRPFNNPFRAVLANTHYTMDQPERIIGFFSLGPILFAFARFIEDELNRLKSLGKKPKVLFLMRDAFLPSKICEILFDGDIGTRVRISRFSAYAASFRTKLDVDRYLTEVVYTNQFESIAKQLLIPDSVAKPLVQATLAAKDPAMQFVKLVQDPDMLKVIFRESMDYRTRLKMHLKQQIDLKDGDTLMFIDLGYSGTAQRLLEPVFKDEMNVDIFGCYLLALAVPGWNTNRVGLLDPHHYDERSLFTCVSYIALLEQLCTTHESSVINYDNEGNPIYSKVKLTDQQHEKLKVIQAECMQFAKEAKQFFAASCERFSLALLRDAAFSNLARLLFFPTAMESNYLATFQFELNLGTQDVFQVFDQDQGLMSLRRRGIIFSFLEKSGKSMRMNYPAEMRSAGVELVLTLMAQHRFGIDLTTQDLSLRKEAVQVIVVQGESASQTVLQAIPTYDGYFALTVPMGAGRFQIGIVFGQKYRWVQLESVELIRTEAYLSPIEASHTMDYWEGIVFDKMTDRGGKLYECTSETSLAMVVPAKNLGNKQHILRVVFRPTVVR